MMKIGSLGGLDTKAAPSKPILVRKAEPSFKRNNSAKQRVTFFEPAVNHLEKSPKKFITNSQATPVASNMTLGQFEHFVSSRLQQTKLKDNSVEPAIRSMVPSRGVKNAQITLKRSIPMASLLIKQANMEKSLRAFTIRGQSKGILFREPSTEDLLGNSNSICLRPSALSIMPFSENLKERSNESYQSASGLFSRQRRKLISASQNKINRTTSTLDFHHSIEELGINPEIERKSIPILT